MIEHLKIEIDGIDIVIFDVKFNDMMEGEIVWNYIGDKRPDDSEHFNSLVGEAVNALIREIDNGKPNI